MAAAPGLQGEGLEAKPVILHIPPHLRVRGLGDTALLIQQLSPDGQLVAAQLAVDLEDSAAPQQCGASGGGAKRRKKDPAKPKKATSAYLAFVNDRRAKVCVCACVCERGAFEKRAAECCWVGWLRGADDSYMGVWAVLRAG